MRKGWPWARRNRRNARRVELDVRLRSGGAMGGAAGVLGRGVVGLAMASLMAGACLAGYWVARDRWLHRTEALALRQLTVTTDGALSREDIVAQARVREGMNTFAIDLPTLRDQLLRHPRLASAEVHRQWPGTLRIQVQERFPVARARVLDKQGIDFAYLLDELGHVMLPFERGHAASEVIEAESALPLLLGAEGAFVVGQVTTHPGVLAALRLLAEYDGSEMATLSDIVSVDVSRAGEVEVRTWLGSRVTFGIPEPGRGFERPLRLWKAVHLDSASRGRLIGSLDLSVTNHVPLRWMDSPAEPARVVPRPAKPARKHARRHG